MLDLGLTYRGYVGPRSNIPGGTLDGGYVRFATPELDAPSLQSMEGHFQTRCEVWVDNNNR